MSYQSSYDTGGEPFRPNKDRGKWSRPSDFLYACICNVIRMDCLYGLSVMPIIANAEISMTFSIIMQIFIYSLPIIFMQTFVGQFSSSGFISVFRIMPLFKGLGYIGLGLNIISLTYFTVFAAVPLMFFFYSLQPTLPWSCEGATSWLYNTSFTVVSHCNINHTLNKAYDTNFTHRIPSVDYFEQHMTTFSFSLYGCVLVVWVGIAYALNNSTETIGHIFRYCSLTLVSLLVLVFVRMLFLPGAVEGFVKNILNAETTAPWEILLSMLLFSSFGPGWGTILSMASYNKFQTNITKYSVLLYLLQLGVFTMIGLVILCTEYHFTQNNSSLIHMTLNLKWATFLSIPSTLANLDSPHVWTWMFLVVLIIGSFNLVLVQMFSILTALFDEFEQLRPYRKEVIFGLTGILALISAAFCTVTGFIYIEILANLNMISQVCLNFALLMIILWIYGRERFQRDMKFMTGQELATWLVFLVRFGTPVFMVVTIFSGVNMLLDNHSSFNSMPIVVTMSYLPFLILPGYCVYRLKRATGNIGRRIQRCMMPADWYPVDPEDRQRYTDAIENPEVLDPLTVDL